MKLIPTLGGSLSGSLGGFTASHNKGGQYLRRRSVPVNPNTGRQQVVRAALGGLTQAWNNELTEAERTAWRTYAENVPRTDKLGQTIQLSGQQWYIAANTPRIQAAAEGLGIFARIDAAPVIFNTGESVLVVDTFEGVFTVPPGTVEIGGDLSAPASADGDVLIYIGAPQNNGVRFFKGPWQLAVAAPVAVTDATFTTSAVTIASAWFSDHIPVVGWDGLFVPLRLRVAYDDGRISQAFEGLIEFTDATP